MVIFPSLQAMVNFVKQGYSSIRDKVIYCRKNRFHALNAADDNALPPLFALI